MNNKVNALRLTKITKAVAIMATALLLAGNASSVQAKQSLAEFQAKQLDFCDGIVTSKGGDAGYVDCQAFVTMQSLNWLEKASQGETARKKRDFCAEDYMQCIEDGYSLYICRSFLFECDNPG